ncbi:MAG: CocE/NonD family hydrolase [Candidatus Dormibacteraeota bacterium]|nr:CocE/NonD family hydrolase [Candidatus Dormibacteraeota bacterium]
MIRQGSRRFRPLLFGVAACAAAFGSFAVISHPTPVKADAKTMSCRSDSNPVFGPSLDALDPCLADTGSSSDNPQYAYGNAIISHVEIPVPQTTLDPVPAPPVGSTANVDYVWLDYIRPAGSATTPVPTIMDESPYYNTLGRGYDGILKTPTDPNAPEAVNVERCQGNTPCMNYEDFPEWLAHYFVPRGYAIALLDIRGTRNSSGCEVYGDKQEGLDGVAAVDWIAGQSWSNQHVGMIGGSYDGTMANGVAALYPTFGQYHNVDGHGTDALSAVVPIRAIDRWYDYQFFNGVEASGQELDPELFTAELPNEDYPTNGDDNVPPGQGSDPSYAQTLAQRKACPGFEQVATDAGYTAPYQDTLDSATLNFWNSRDYLQYTPTWKAATFFIHGLFDNNVKTMNSGQLWNALQNCGAPGAGTTCRNGNAPPTRYLWFNGGHADPDTPSYAVEQSSGNEGEYLEPYTYMQKFEHEVHQWFLQYLKGVDDGAAQAPKAEIQRDYDDPGDTLQQGHWDSYSQWPATTQDSVLHFNSDNTATTTAEPSGSVQWADGASSAAGSQSFLTTAFTTDTRISGQFEFDLNISATGTDTTVAVEVDDVPPGAENDTNQASEDRATNTDPFAFTFGYIRAAYRGSINGRGVSYPTNATPMTPGTAYPITFPSTYTDYIVRAGHKLRFTLSDASPYSIAADTGNTVTMNTGLSDGTSLVKIPVATTGPSTGTPEFGDIASIGGPVIGLVIGCMITLVLPGRRRRHRS